MITVERENLIQEIKSALRIEEEFRADGCDLIASGRDFECCCPFHSERSASCKVHPDEKYFKCFGCGAGGDVLDYLAMVKFNKACKACSNAEFVEVLREGSARSNIEFVDVNSKEPPKQRTIFTLEKLKSCCEFQAKENNETVSQWNEYTNPETKAIEAISIRFQRAQKKRILQATPNGDGFSFGLQGDGRKQPLFNRARIRDVEIVVFVEGETKVRLLQKREIVATCNLGGSKAIKNTDLSPLIGKSIVIWRDFDDAGIHWEKDLIELLDAMQIVHSSVDVSQTAIEKGDDVVDFDARIAGDESEKAEKILDILRASFAETLESQISADASGKRYALKHESSMCMTSTNCFLPGSITMLCGSPGASKSFFVLQLVWQWFLNGIDCSLLALESGIVFHERRALAQMAGNNGLLDPQYVLNNPEIVKSVLVTFGGEIDRMRRGKVIQSPNDEKVSCEFLLRWVESEWKRKQKLAVIDPITMLETGDKFWQEQQDFVRELKRLVRRSQMRVLLVTHPSKNAQKIHEDNMAGCIAFSQNSDSIFWLESHGRLEKIDSSMGENFGKRYAYNRTIHVLKTRFGFAEKPTIGIHFNGGTLGCTEVGFLESV